MYVRVSYWTKFSFTKTVIKSIWYKKILSYTKSTKYNIITIYIVILHWKQLTLLFILLFWHFQLSRWHIWSMADRYSSDYVITSGILGSSCFRFLPVPFNLLPLLQSLVLSLFSSFYLHLVSLFFLPSFLLSSNTTLPILLVLLSCFLLLSSSLFSPPRLLHFPPPTLLSPTPSSSLILILFSSSQSVLIPWSILVSFFIFLRFTYSN